MKHCLREPKMLTERWLPGFFLGLLARVLLDFECVSYELATLTLPLSPCTVSFDIKEMEFKEMTGPIRRFLTKSMV